MKLRAREWKKSLYFDDGNRIIDDIKRPNAEAASFARTTFRKALLKEGVDLEEDVQTVKGGEITYLKVHIPWELMCRLAEDLKLRAALQFVVDEPKKKYFPVLTEFFRTKAPNYPQNRITCPFREDCIENYLGHRNRETFFSPVQRHQAAYQILATTPYGDPELGQVGVQRLVEEGIFSAFYPLHEGPYNATDEESQHPENLSRRQVLYRYWARWGCWSRHQPLDHIREYYGEKIALYFAWLGCYTQLLLPVAIIGLACFLYGAFTTSTFVPAREVCDPAQPIRMCPLCEEYRGCEHWYLHTRCLYRLAAYLFDNPGSVFFAITMVLWSVIFLEVWKRRCSTLAHRWNVFDYELDEEEFRPQFVTLCTQFGRNPVTGRMEPVFSKRIRISRIFIGIMISLVLLTLVIIFLIAVIIYRSLVEIPLYRDPSVRSYAGVYASLTGSVLNFLLIMTLGTIYQTLAFKMTEWEMHETQTAFDTYFAIKVFLFQFINYYASVFYIAFFKGRFIGRPGEFATFLGLRVEVCATGGCLVELAQQIFINIIGMLLINNSQEILIPKLKSWVHRRTTGIQNAKNNDGKTTILVIKQYIKDYRLINYEGLSHEYLEMVILFGFITIFGAAFPLGPLFALINNWLEIRIDAQKLVCSTRRPVAQRAKSIGIWFQFMEFIVTISIITNAFIIAFTSEFLDYILYAYEIDPKLHGYTNFTLMAAPKLTTRMPCMYQDYRNEAGEYTAFYWKLLILRLTFVIIFEHIVFSIARLLDFVIPDIPEKLDVSLRRERFLARRATLSNNKTQLMSSNQSGK